MKKFIGNVIALAIMLLITAIAITIFALLVVAVIYSWKNCILA